MKINWNEEKNNLLKETRNVSFDMVLEEINKKRYLLIEHHSEERSNQYIILARLHNYIHAVPCVIAGDEIFLKSIMPSRKYNKKYEDEL
jgi:uncharacterized DUF497 family protein